MVSSNIDLKKQERKNEQQRQTTAASDAAASSGSWDERGRGSGSPGLAEAQREAETASDGEHPLIGQPHDPQEVEVGGA